MRAQDDLISGEFGRAHVRTTPSENARPAVPAESMSMPACGGLSRLKDSNVLAISLGDVCYHLGRHPFSSHDLAELMRMTLEASMVAATLVD